MFSKILKTAAVVGLTGLGMSATMATSADAVGFKRCDGYGCYRVMCDQRGLCVRSGGYISSAYVAPPAHVDGTYRSVRVCDTTGCHLVRQREPNMNVSVSPSF
jgi:hypothetical protein